MVGKLVAKPMFHWEVDVECFRDKNSGDAVVSPLLITTDLGGNKNQWELKLYPKNYRESERGFVSLFVFNLSSRKTIATINLAILNQETLRYERVQLIKGCLFKTNKSENHWGIIRYIEESYLMDTRNNLIKNNKIILVCNIVEERIVLTFGSEDEDKIENERLLKRIKLLDDFEKLLTDNYLSDFTVTAPDGKTFSLHKCILSAHSMVFERMFKNDMQEKSQNLVKIEDIKFEVLQELFRFIYTGKISNGVENIISELFIAAEKYCIGSLKELCEDMMVNNLENRNALECLKFAVMNNAEKLESGAITYVAINIDDFIKNQDFDEFGSQNPTMLLKIMKKLRNV